MSFPIRNIIYLLNIVALDHSLWLGRGGGLKVQANAQYLMVPEITIVEYYEYVLNLSFPTVVFRCSEKNEIIMFVIGL